jgi:hypothetical protein
VTVLNPGSKYVVGDTLSASSGNIGGTSGFSVPVSSTAINSSLAGGSVGMYTPSTLSTKQTWQDSGETILNSNPVPLDANGCAIMYGGGTYRQILFDSLGNTVWDQPTTAVGSTSGITQLTGDVTAGPGSGAQATTIAAAAVTSAKIANSTIVAANVATHGLTLANLPQASANTVEGNPTGSPANRTDMSMPSCPDGSGHLNWISGTGFACGTSGSTVASSIAFGYSGTTTIGSGGSAKYVGLNSVNGTLANVTPYVAPAAGHISSITVAISTNAVSSITATLYDNGSSTSVACTVSSSAQTCTTTGLTVAFSAQDQLLVNFTASGGSTSTSWGTATIGIY